MIQIRTAVYISAANFLSVPRMEIVTKVISQDDYDQQIPKLNPCHPGKLGVHACHAMKLRDEVSLRAEPPATGARLGKA
jgi:hypothetical protein